MYNGSGNLFTGPMPKKRRDVLDINVKNLIEKL